MLPSESEIHALVQLLDDSDKEVRSHVYSRIKSFGVDVIPALEGAWTVELNALQHDRLEELIRDIHFQVVVDELEAWVSSIDQDLLLGFYILSKYFNPELDYDVVQKQVFRTRQSIWLEMNYNQTPLEQIQIFNQIFYGYHGYSGVQLSEHFKDYTLDHLLETKNGTSIALGILYQIIARDLNLPVYGVPLIKFFVSCFCKRTIGDFSEPTANEGEIMFYINPVNRGSLFSKNEIKEYLDKMKLEEEPRYYAPASNKAILTELLTYFAELASFKSDAQKETDFAKLLRILNS
ncbi:MAG: hypothetical protein JST90_02255 [Bacteroidetes bacterium]|nr:hypothetical protein [Bacteroidota bacterium]